MYKSSKQNFDFLIISTHS